MYVTEKSIPRTQKLLILPTINFVLQVSFIIFLLIGKRNCINILWSLDNTAQSKSVILIFHYLYRKKYRKRKFNYYFWIKGNLIYLLFWEKGNITKSLKEKHMHLVHENEKKLVSNVCLFLLYITANQTRLQFPEMFLKSFCPSHSLKEKGNVSFNL